MSKSRTLLDEALEAWGYARAGVIDELRNLPAGRMDHRPAPGMRSVRELVQHILETAMMFAGEIARPDTNVHRAPWPGLIKLYAPGVKRAKTKVRLLALLRTQRRDLERRLRGAGDLEMHQFMTRFDRERWTKLSMMHHGIAHEEYHRGQLALYARTLGLEPALTRRIRGG